MKVVREVYEFGYGDHKRMCLFPRAMLDKVGYICNTFISMPNHMLKNAAFEIKVARKMFEISIQHMFDSSDEVIRIELSVNELVSLKYCVNQALFCDSSLAEWGSIVKDYILKIEIGKDNSVFDKSVEKPLKAKIRKL